MADDLAQGPRSELITQLCGDAHLSNFGVFASPERRLVFDLNDFDETHPGPFEWDVKRLAASLEIAGRDNGYTGKQRRSVVLSAVNSYRRAMREFAAQSNLVVWYAHQAIQPGLPGLSAVQSQKTRRTVQKTLDEARMRDNLGSLKKLTELADGQLRFVSKPPLVVPARDLPIDADATADLAGWMTDVLHKYSESLQSDRRHLIHQYKFVDLARKVVGVGSVGTRAWIMLLSGIDDQDPLLLQAKEANASVLEAYTSPTPFSSNGERVVQGQRLMQAYGDVLWVGTTFRTAHGPITTFVNCATGKDRSRYPPSILNHLPCTPGIAHGPWRGRMQGLAIGSLLRPISAAKMHSIKQLPTFQPPTPTRTNATLLVLRMPQLPDRSRWNEDFKRAASPEPPTTDSVPHGVDARPYDDD